MHRVTSGWSTNEFLALKTSESRNLPNRFHEKKSVTNIKPRKQVIK
jgi:hypothetical protein